MIQQARRETSTSLLREAEQAVLVFETDEQTYYFQTLISQIVENRKDPNVRYTGAKDARRQILALLHQYGEIETANVWCRGLIVDLAHVEHLQKLIAQALADENIYGVVEIHLQDREINSPHIQFVGIKAAQAEDIISKIVVDLKYELSVETAKGSRKGFIPQHQIDEHAKTLNLSYFLEREQRRRLIQDFKEEFKDSSDFIQKMKEKRTEFLKILDAEVDRAREKLKEFRLPNVFASKKIYEKTTEEAVNDINERIKEFRR